MYLEMNSEILCRQFQRENQRFEIEELQVRDPTNFKLDVFLQVSLDCEPDVAQHYKLNGISLQFSKESSYLSPNFLPGQYYWREIKVDKEIVDDALRKLAETKTEENDNLIIPTILPNLL